MNSPIQFRFLGTPAAYQMGKRIRLYSAKVFALVAYLALQPDKAHSREQLAGLLWGERSDQRAYASLRQALYSVRQVLGDEADRLLQIERESVGLRLLDTLQVDAWDLSAAWKRGDFARVVDLYSGPLLDGLKLSDCPDYETWLFLQRESFEQKTIAALQQHVAHLLSSGAYDNALPHATRLMELDFLNEEGHRLLMKIHASRGDQSAARRQYQLCVELLARELGVEPMPETTSLFQQLENVSQAQIIVQAEPIRAVQSIADLPMAERESELAALTQAWQAAAENPQNLFFIQGEVGAGKSRLVQEFIKQNQISRVLIGRCFEVDVNMPLAPWSDLLRQLTQSAWQREIADLKAVWMREVARIVPTLTIDHDADMDDTMLTEKRLRLLQGIVHCLLQLTSSPLLLVFEDLHWADETSIELLHYAARQLTQAPILFVGTYRPGSPNRRLQQLVRSVQDGASVIEIASLSERAVQNLITTLPFSMPSQLIQQLYQFSVGNPFVLAETLRAFAERVEQGFNITAPSTMPISERVRQLVLDRLQDTDEGQRRILESAALIGRPFDFRLLRNVSGTTEANLLEQLDFLLARGFIHTGLGSDQDDVLDIAHAYSRQVIVQSLSTPRRLALHRRIAETLERLSDTNVDEIAFHFEQASNSRGVDYLVRAAQEAEAVFALGSAANFYQRALRLLDAVDRDNVHRRLEIYRMLETIYDQVGNRAEQSGVLDALVNLAEQLDDHELLADIYVREASYFTYTAQYVQSQQALQAALDQYQAMKDSARQANALHELGFLHWTTGNYTAALAYNRNALHLHRLVGNLNGQATALHNLAEIHRGLGSAKQSIDMYNQAVELQWSIGNLRGLALSLYGMANAHRAVRQYDEAAHYYTQSLEQCLASKNRVMQSRVYHALATLHWETGNHNAAFRYLIDAVDMSIEIGYSMGAAHSLLLLSVYYCQQGDLSQARARMEEAIEWLQLSEDTRQLNTANIWLRALDDGRVEAIELPTNMQAIRSHVKVPEGKIYCEFESPLARVRQDF